jgi:hypothetical protein
LNNDKGVVTGVLLRGEANVHKRSWNGDGKETNGHSGACTARPANTDAGPAHSPWRDCDEQSRCMQLRCVKAWCCKRSQTRAKPTFTNAAGMETERRPTATVVPALPDQRTPCWPSALPLVQSDRATSKVKQ